MKKILFPFVLFATLYAGAQNYPERAIILSGDSTRTEHVGNVALMYSRTNLAFADPAAPRFLFLDKKGEVALGIGGFVKAVGMYDMCGAVDNNDFYTNKIPVPFNPAQRNRFGASAAHSSIFLKLVSSPTKVGRVIVYIQTNFTGDNGGYGLKMDQAYVKVGHITAGKARSTFSDGPAMAPTVDDQGPSGQVTAKNMMVRYESSNYKGFSGAISVEVPQASYTEGARTSAISQRFPDIPAYVQYGWNEDNYHVRLSGILRQLSYRDELKADNRFATGWGVQFSTVAGIVGGLKLFGHYTYGKGIGSYINDLVDQGYDLVPAADGKLKAPAASGWTAGLEYDFSKNFFVSGSYSQARLYDCKHMGADTYDYGQYLAFNAYYTVLNDLRLGIEYLHGNRKNIGGESGKANRVEAMIQYNF